MPLKIVNKEVLFVTASFNTSPEVFFEPHGAISSYEGATLNVS